MPSIEELIHQSKFRNEKHKCIVSIICASNLICNHHEDILEKYGLTLQQFNVLRILRGQHPAPSTVNLIRERMLDKMSDASRIVERLRKIDLVERVQCERDRRAVDVLITKKGLNVLSQIDKLESRMQQPFSKLTDKDAKLLNELLAKVLDGFD